MTGILQGKKSKCAFCKGSGIQPRSLRSRCIACRGKGEVEFENPIKCPSCQGMGRTSPSSLLSCVNCRGVGVIEKHEKGGGAADIIGERLGEIAKRLKWTRKETEKRTKELKKETQWPEELGNKIKKGWQSLWED